MVRVYNLVRKLFALVTLASEQVLTVAELEDDAA